MVSVLSIKIPALSSLNFSCSKKIVLCNSWENELASSIKNIFFVPFGQDNYLSKPNSMIAHVDLIEDTIEKALGGRQIQPVIKSPHVTIL